LTKIAQVVLIPFLEMDIGRVESGDYVFTSGFMIVSAAYSAMIVRWVSRVNTEADDLGKFILRNLRPGQHVSETGQSVALNLMELVKLVEIDKVEVCLFKVRLRKPLFYAILSSTALTCCTVLAKTVYVYADSIRH